MTSRRPAASPQIGRRLLLFPAAYGLHIGEEYLFNFPAWLSRLAGEAMSIRQFLFLNGVFWSITLAAVLLARSDASRSGIAVALATVFATNTALHLLGSVVTATYSPGLATAVLLYVPLVVLVVRHVLPRQSLARTLGAVGIGAAIHALVLLLATNPSRIPSL